MASTQLDTRQVFFDLCGRDPELLCDKMNSETSGLRALCVGRHEFLSNHFAHFFSELGIETQAVVGLAQAPGAAREFKPNVVISDYDLLATLSLEAWERDELLSNCPVIAVSLTRRPTEAHLLDVNGIAGFFYLPQMNPSSALRQIAAAAEASRAKYVPSPPVTSPLATIPG